MSPSTPQLLGCAAALAGLATWALARLAPRLGWIDAGDGARKLQRVPLAPVGGAAIALTLAALWSVQPACAASAIATPGWKAAALLSAFAVGLVDDLVRGGLRPRAKLAGQAMSGLVLAAPHLARVPQEPAALLVALALLCATLVALNGLNTYDNSDGAAGCLALLGLAPAAPLAAAAVAGFLPFNLIRRRGAAERERDGGARAILGDSGSHLLGMALLVTPGAWPALALPLFDLARVCIERLRCGQAPWVGDRRHLAHRLVRSGLSPAAAAFCLGALAAPSALLGSWGPTAGALGVLATLGLALVALRCTRAARGTGPADPARVEACRAGTRAG